jgi:hypothetical protein
VKPCCGKLVPFAYAQPADNGKNVRIVVREELVRSLPEYIRHLVERHEQK